MDPALTEFLTKLLEHGGSASLLGIAYLAWQTSRRLVGALDDVSAIREALTNDRSGLPAIRAAIDAVERDVQRLPLPTIRHGRGI